jgi:neurotrimin
VPVDRAHMKLTIKNLSAGDFGNYRCISKNSLGETEGSIRVYGRLAFIVITV